MQPLRWERRPDGLRAPALVCAFKGWNDAGEAASAAVSFIRGSFDASEVANIDPEEYYDFQVTRPHVRLADARGARTLAFPAISLGIYGYPARDGARIALRTVRDHLTGETGIQLVRFVLRGAIYDERTANGLAELDTAP